MHGENLNCKISQVLAKAWADGDFKAKLIANPVEVLQAEGIEVPSSLKVNVLENTNENYFLVIPNKTGELSDEQLDRIAGGFNGDKYVRCPTCGYWSLYYYFGNCPQCGAHHPDYPR